MLAEAKKRLQAEPDKYINHVYGEKEVGGTSWLYISPVPFEKMGMPALGDQPVTLNVERAMSLVPPVLLGVAAAMSAVYWLGKRPKKNDKKKDGDKSGVPG
jgi:formate dehydrogenase iron-sulfur subunit